MDHVTILTVAAPDGCVRSTTGPHGAVVRWRDDRCRLEVGSIAVAAFLAVVLTGAPARPAVPREATTTAATAARQPRVVPGGLVRWAGSDIASCGLDGRSWPPYDDACWIPIDLMRAPGIVEIERTRHGVVERTTLRVDEYPYPTQHLKVAPDMASPPDSQLERIRRESERVSALWSLDGPTLFELPLRPPLDPMPEARSFGSRRMFNGEPRDPHSGIDLSAPVGAAVHAAAAGSVIIAADHYFSGRSVFIDHGDGLITMYFHLDRIDVREGDSVARGQVIGAVGETGRATGPHLHFGVRWHGARIDPTPLLDGPARVAEIETTDRD